LFITRNYIDFLSLSYNIEFLYGDCPVTITLLLLTFYTLLYNYVDNFAAAKQAERDSVEWSTADENIVNMAPKFPAKRVSTNKSSQVKSRKVCSNESSGEESCDSGISLYS
jgi:hypothetical protein